MSLILVIGNKNYSAWSLRAWLYLKQSGIPFTELRITMFTAEWSAQIEQYSPTKRVPVLLDGEIIAAGPWLFGEFSIADIMFVPVALRFVSYNIPLGSTEQEFIDAVRGLPAIQEWVDAAEREEETIALFDERRPLRDEASSLG